MANQVALITGASRGLGAVLARFLVQQGYDLVVTARGEEALEAIAQSLQKSGGSMRALPGHVSDQSITDDWLRLTHLPLGG